MKKLLIATNNPDKLREYQELLVGLPLEVTYPARQGLDLDPEETGSTFEENAIIKALAFARASGLLTWADDSGLEVDALGGQPGVYSARYGGTAKDDHAGRCRLVLDKLATQNIAWAERTARFRCVIALASPERMLNVVHGAVEGLIAYEMQGVNGFGYDPIFYVPEFGQTLGQIESALKHTISHRGRAARAAVEIISRLIKA
jgi:XTP/dITP diphosphohydrolase